MNLSTGLKLHWLVCQGSGASRNPKKVSNSCQGRSEWGTSSLGWARQGLTIREKFTYFSSQPFLLFSWKEQFQLADKKSLNCKIGISIFAVCINLPLWGCARESFIWVTQLQACKKRKSFSYFLKYFSCFLFQFFFAKVFNISATRHLVSSTSPSPSPFPFPTLELKISRFRNFEFSKDFKRTPWIGFAFVI